MKLKFILSVILMLNLSVLFSQEWIDVQITSFSKISFPAQPEAAEEMNTLNFIYQDSIAIYFVNITDFSKVPENRLPPNGIDGIYESFNRGNIESVAGKFMDQATIKIGDIQGVDVYYEVPSDSVLGTQRFMRNVFVDNVMISCQLWTNENESSEFQVIKSKFYDSLSFDGDGDGISQELRVNNKNTLAYKIGYFMPLILFTGLIVLIAFWIKRLKLKKQKYG